MDRRRFAHLSALALAATQLPSRSQAVAQTASQSDAASYRIGYAPVGLGDISTIFMQAVQSSQHARIGLVTGHPAAGPDSVEQTVECVMKFPSNNLATCGSSYGQDGPAFLQIDGSTGQIHIQPAYYYGDVLYTLNSKPGPESGVIPANNYAQFTAEADHLAACIRNNRTPDTPGEEGLADLLAIEAIYRAAGAPIA